MHNSMCCFFGDGAVKEGHKLDIKEIILLGGGLLLVAVIGHGIWVARRSRQGDLKMEISPKNFRDADDEPLPEEPLWRRRRMAAPA